MSELYPLRFTPILRRYLWGGRRLGTVLGKSIGEGDDYAESWELCDLGENQSRVAAGSLQGVSLHQLVAQHGTGLLGRHAGLNRFPLLLKFLDARERLSVQVHPDDARASRLTPPSFGKTEAWVILDAEHGSRVYAGLQAGFDRAALEREVAQGTCDLCLAYFEPAVGDCVFLPAGTVHALGEGLLVAEIQQASDITYRLFDWNRFGPDGKPRELHVEKALDAIDYGRGPVAPQEPQPTDRPAISRLVACDHFILDRWTFDAPQAAGGDSRCHILAVLEGAVAVQGDPSGEPLPVGGTMLLPAELGPVRLEPRGRAVLLDMYLP
jgi:mannose-6-phosphate isomerase